MATEVGLRVREARVRRRLTTHDLAYKLKISERTVRKVEKGDPSVKLGTVLSACVLLDLDFTAPLQAHSATKRVGRRAPEIAASETDF